MSYTSDLPQRSAYRDLLLPHQRPIRKDLSTWTSNILQSFERNVQRDWREPIVCHDIGGCFNQLALVQAYFGRPDVAAALSHALIGWIAAAVARTGCEECYGAAFEPFLNLGRLDRIYNRSRDALRCFATIRRAFDGEAVCLGDIQLPASTVARVFADQDLVRVLREAVIVDPLKTMLRAEMFDALEQFVREEAAFAGDREGAYLTEATVVAHASRGMFDAAEDVLREYLKSPRPANVAVMRYRRAEILAMRGRSDDALAMLAPAAAQCVNGAHDPGKYSVALLLQVARLHLRCRRPDLAEQVAARCRKAAASLGDVPYQCDAIELLQQCTVSPDARSTLEQDLHRLKAAAGWGQAKAGSACREGDGYSRIVSACDVLFGFAADCALSGVTPS